jgi:hypothetical protein
MAEEITVAEEGVSTPAAEQKRRLPQDAVDRMNRAIEAGKSPAGMEDAIYSEMFS